MSRIGPPIRVAFAVFLTVWGLGSSPAGGAEAPHAANSAARVDWSFAKLSLSFEPNLGQAPQTVKFMSRTHGGTLFLTPTGATFALTRGHIPDYKAMVSTAIPKTTAQTPVARPTVESHAMRISFAGANRNAAIEGVDRLSGVTHYFVGKDPRKWHTGIPNFAKVRFHRIYRGIDLVFYRNAGGFEYDFVVAPRAKPRDIRLRLEGAEKAEIAPSGDLLINFGGEQLSLRKPALYQQVNGHRKEIDGGYVKLARSTYGIRAGKYDRSIPLVIDPTLVWAAYAGGNFLDVPSRVATDSLSNPYITGMTCSSSFPETTIGAAKGGCDGFVAKLDASTGNVDYFAVIGGSGFDNSLAIAVDQTGSAYIAGQTFSADFAAPATQDPALTQKHGIFDAFVAKLDPNGNLLWSRLLGGSTPTANFLNLGWSLAFGVAVPQGCSPMGTPCNVYLAGQTTTTDFPTANAFQGTNPNDWNGFVTELTADGLHMPYSTYFGGEPGPNNDGQGNWAYSIAVDSIGKAYVVGGSDVATIHTTIGDSYKGVRDTWVAMFDPSLSTAATRVWASFLGGSSRDDPGEIALEPNCTSPCASYVSGTTNSDDFHVTPNAYQTVFGGAQNGFAAKFDGLGTLLYSTYLGDAYGFNGQGISVDSTGSPYIVGLSSSPSLPLNNSIQGPQLPLAILLKSTDGANTFGPVPIPVNASAVQGIAIDPSNTSTVYLGTNQNGLWKSTNGGGTFTQIGLAGQYARPAIDPNNSSIVYAATGNGVMRSTNAGANFSATSLTSNVVLAFAFDTSTNPSTVYSSTEEASAVPGSTGQVFKSTDGTNFTPIAGLSVATVSGIAFDPNSGSVYAATSVGPYVTSNFAPTGSMTVGRFLPAAVRLADGQVLITGGSTIDTPPWLSSAEIYDPPTGTFMATAGSMTAPRRDHTATLLTDGTVLITGGYSVNDMAVASAELFDPSNGGSFTATGPMSVPRGGHTATLLIDGRVLVAGGDGGGTAEIYDPVHHSFGAPITMTQARSGHTATLLQDGRVLLTGGAVGTQFTATAELFSPTANSFIATVGSMSVARGLHVAALLDNGKVLVAAGTDNAQNFDPGTLSSAELYDPAQDHFSLTGSLKIGRNGPTATTLSDGRVLIVGGTGPFSQSGFTGEVYSPTTGQFAIAGSFAPRMVQPTVTLLTNGSALVTGGNGSDPSDPSAELYNPNSAGFQPTGQHFSPSFAVAVDPTTTPSTVYASFLQGILRLNDGFWIDFNRTNPYDSIALDTSSHPATLYAGNGNGEIITSTNQGNDFKVQNLANFRPGNLFPVGVSSSAPGLVYAGSFEQFDWFVYKLDPTFRTLQFSSYLGGSAGDFAQDVVVGPGATYVVGGSGSSDFNGVSSGTLTGNDNPVVARLPNTLTGSNVTVQPDPSTNVTYSSVTSGGQTTATTDAAPPSLPPNLQLVSATDVTTTATYTASDADPIVVCLRYDPSAVTNPQDLSLMHYENGMWINVTTSNDTVKGLICGGVTTLSPFAVVKGTPISVSIMIKPPGAAPVPINLSSAGNIPVAILSNSNFDATKIQPSTILLDCDKVRLKGNGGFQCSAQDVNGDGKPDLVCQVPTNQFQLIPGSDQAILTAVTTGNQYIQGSEAITIVNQ